MEGPDPVAGSSWLLLKGCGRLAAASQEGQRQVSALVPYEDNIAEHWQEGCRGATRTWRELSEQGFPEGFPEGYPGAYQNVVRITRYLKEQEVLENYYRTVRRVSPPGEQPASS